MTAPTEQTLFEKIRNQIVKTPFGTDVYIEPIHAICIEHDKRLADAEKNGLTNAFRVIEEREKAEALSQQLESAHTATRDQIEVAQRAVDELQRVRKALSAAIDLMVQEGFGTLTLVPELRKALTVAPQQELIKP